MGMTEFGQARLRRWLPEGDFLFDFARSLHVNQYIIVLHSLQSEYSTSGSVCVYDRSDGCKPYNS